MAFRRPKLPDVDSPAPEEVLEGVPSADEVLDSAPSPDESRDERPSVDDLLGNERHGH